VVSTDGSPPAEALATSGLCQHIVDMTTKLTRLVQAAIKDAPCSLRALAREADIDVSLLSRIASGEREATQEAAMAVAGALDRWGDRCKASARKLEKGLNRKEGRA